MSAMEESKQISVDTVADRVTERLREMIMSRELRAGSRINQSEVAERLGVSRTPIREAIQRLESVGLVRTVPYKGAYVGQLDATDIREIFELRRLIEGFAVRLAVSRLSKADLQELAEFLGTADARVEEGERDLYFEGDLRLHNLFMENCGNSRLGEALEPFANQVEAFRYSAGQLPGDHWRQSHEEHKGILEAALQGDAVGASRRMEAHIGDSLERVLKLLDT